MRIYTQLTGTPDYEITMRARRNIHLTEILEKRDK